MIRLQLAPTEKEVVSNSNRCEKGPNYVLDTEEKVAIKIIQTKSNPKEHMVAPLQCQVERHMSKKEKEYELIDFRLRSEPIPWK